MGFGLVSGSRYIPWEVVRYRSNYSYRSQSVVRLFARGQPKAELFVSTAIGTHPELQRLFPPLADCVPADASEAKAIFGKATVPLGSGFCMGKRARSLSITWCAVFGLAQKARRIAPFRPIMLSPLPGFGKEFRPAQNLQTRYQSTHLLDYKTWRYLMKDKLPEISSVSEQG
jgi:hypothetical protein